MSLTPAEKKVRKLARLTFNTECPNCGTVKQFGFSTVCIKYFTFVCSNCKTSHQAISHRCKSLTMSSWTDAEVAELERKGNDYARRTWLKNAPPVGSGGRPREGDDINVFKRFIVEAYEKKRYYGEDDGGNGGVGIPTAAGSTSRMAVATAVPLSGPPPTPSTGFRANASASAPRTVSRPPVSAPPAPAPATAPVADLLDFSSVPSSTTTTNQASSTGFVANFDAFGSSPAAELSTPAPAALPAPSTTTVHDPFAPVSTTAPPSSSSSSAAATTTTSALTSSGFSFISSPSPAAAATATATSTTTHVSASPAITKKPVMSNQTMSDKSSFISSMSLPSSTSTGQQAPMGFGSGVVAGSNSMNGMATMPQRMHQQPQPISGFGTSNNMSMNMMNMQAMQQQQQQMQMQMMGMGMQGVARQGMMNTMAMNGGGAGFGGSAQPMMMATNARNGGAAGGGGFGGGSTGISNMNMMMTNTNSNGSGNSNGMNAKSNMNSLDMNISSMSKWTSGGK